MPAPNRRAVGASLAQRVAGSRITDISDVADRNRAHRDHMARRWEAAEAAAVEDRPHAPHADLERPPPPMDHAAWRHFLGLPCPAHGAGPGRPCFEHPVALCGRRVAQ